MTGGPLSPSLRCLQVVEDVTEGHVVTGLSTRIARNAEELRGLYNSGRANRDTQVCGHANRELKQAAVERQRAGLPPFGNSAERSVYLRMLHVQHELEIYAVDSQVWPQVACNMLFCR